MADPNAGSFTPINIWAMLRDLINNSAPILTNAGSPTSGASGTFVNQAGPGALLIDYTNAVLYINTNTKASPTWTALPTGGAGTVTSSMIAASAVSTAKIAANAVTSAKIDSSVIQIATGSISSANITGTSAGQLGHANGVVLVAASAAGSITQLISAVFANDFLTAAYTGGGNTTVNISGGGAALTGLVSNANFIQAGSDKIIEFVPLAATFNNYATGANGLALVSASAPTQPGTAAGVINWAVAYRVIPSLLD